MPDIDTKWTLDNVPPKGHKDVAKFAADLFDIAIREKERLGKPKDFISNYALYRGKQTIGTANTSVRTPVNLFFANIERTVSNITARQPVGEVVDLDGIKDGAEEIFSVKLKKWWLDTGQQTKTRAGARTMEIYGICPEKPFWDKIRRQPDVSTIDPFAFFPAPGLYDDISTEAPYVCFAYLDYVSHAETEFGVSGIAEEDAYQLLGVEREKYKGDSFNTQQRIGNYADPMYRVNREAHTSSDPKIERCLIIEVWLRDKRQKTTKEIMPALDEAGEPIPDDDGMPLVEQITTKGLVYPDGVRKITITKAKPGSDKNKASSGDYMVLDDSPNPNINPALEVALAEQTHPWGRFPVYTINSYRDLVTIWGFSAAEQVGDLIFKINRIVSKLVAYVINVMDPPLIIQKNCGITRAMVESAWAEGGKLVLQPYSPNARIEFLQIPDLPSTFFQVLELIIRLFDRVYQIEDADRGEAPKGVIAASAIVALQERNQVLMQAKTSSIDALVEQRSRWAIGLWQNFGTDQELVEVADQPVEFIGALYAGRKFSFVVEAGSTTPRTSLQVQELAQALYQQGAIDRRAVLESVNFPNWRLIVERMGETALDTALGVLVAAGLPEEDAIMLKQMLMQTQGGPGDTGSAGGAAPVGQVQKVQPGSPKASQGKQPPAEVRGEG
jgi:hypothetical protein